MTIQLRVMCDGEVKEYTFDRERIAIGRGPANDLVIASKSAGITHGALTWDRETKVLTFRVEQGLSHTTLLVRDGGVRGEVHIDQAGSLDLEQGDFLILGEHVRVEILRLEEQRADALERFDVVPFFDASTTPPSTSFAHHYVLASERVAHAPLSVDVLLRELHMLASEGIGQPPIKLSFVMYSAEEEFHDERWTFARDTLQRHREHLSPSSTPSTRLRSLLQKEGAYLVERTGAQAAWIIHIPITQATQLLGSISLSFSRARLSTQEALLLEKYVARSSAALSALLVHAYLSRRRMESVCEENRYFRERERRHYLFKDLICESKSMRRVYARLHDLVERVDEPVLIVGEAGTGKELLGRALHHLSARQEGMFISLQCAHTADEVLGVELFGCVASELAGALAARKGVFELARGGTVYLEEVDRLSLALQGKLARMIREGEVRRVGDAVGRQVDARLVVSTNRALPELIEEGVFRHDLYLLLKDGLLEVPALRDRKEDIMPLARNFLKVLSSRHDRSSHGFSADVGETFESYTWPGNVRQLQTFVEAALLRQDESLRPLEKEDFVF